MKAAMNDTDQPAPSVPDEQHVTELLRLMNNLTSLLSDPAVTKSRLEQLTEATASARDAIDTASRQKAAIDAHRDAIEAQLDRLRQAHVARLDEERSVHDAKIAEQTADAADKQRRATELLAKATADAEHAAKIKDTLTKKLAALQAA